MKPAQQRLDEMIGSMVTMEVAESGGAVWRGSYYGRLMYMPEVRRYGLESGSSGRVYHLFTMGNVRQVGIGRIKCAFAKPAAAAPVKPAAVPKMTARAVSVS